MLSILFNNLTIDDIQDDVSDMLGFLLKYLGQKADFLAHFERFFCLCPLTPYELHHKTLPTERPC